MSENAPPPLFVPSRSTGTRFSGLGWPLWRVMLLCVCIGLGCAVFSIALGVLIKAVHP